MRTSLRFRTGLLLTLALSTALPPLSIQASAPDEAAMGATDPAADLLRGASGALAALGDTIDAIAQTVVDTVSPAAGPCSGFGGLDYGDDGRLTVLLLGSDYRIKRYIGERMDIIVVVTRRPDGRVAFASIPRDMVYLPKASGGTSGVNRVNTMYYSYMRRKSDLDGVDCSALRKFTRDVATALRTEIDYYAMVRFTTFINLVDRVGHVAVDVPGPIIDSYLGRRGVYFPDEDDYRLEGHTGCRKTKPCHSALSYVRSRHGTQAGAPNNDFKRAYRQHDFIFDAMKRVRARGNGAALTDLLEGIVPKVWTNIPKNIYVARDIYDIIGSISLSSSDKVVFGPTTYASSSGVPQYTFKPKLSKIRTWINVHFGS